MSAFATVISAPVADADAPVFAVALTPLISAYAALTLNPCASALKVALA